MKKFLYGVIAISVLLGVIAMPGVFAHPHHNVTITQLNDEIALETVVTTMTVPQNTDLQWATMKGSISDPVDWYPIIIQFYKDDEPVRFAQVDLKGDNSYEYQFQIRNLDSGSVLDIFEGEYTVKVSAVVYHKDHIN